MTWLIVFRRSPRDLAEARKLRGYAREYSAQASSYYAQGTTAPAVVDDLLDVHVRANEIDGGTQWPA